MKIFNIAFPYLITMALVVQAQEIDEEIRPLLIDERVEVACNNQLFAQATRYRTFLEARNLSNITVQFKSDDPTNWKLSPGESRINDTDSCKNTCYGTKYQFYKLSGDKLCNGVTPFYTADSPCFSIVFNGSKCSVNTCTSILNYDESDDCIKQQDTYSLNALGSLWQTP